MSLVTRCPACTTLFKVVPDQLRISGGWVRCGHCSEVFDAATHMLTRDQVLALQAAEAEAAAAQPPAPPGAEHGSVDATRTAAPQTSPPPAYAATPTPVAPSTQTAQAPTAPPRPMPVAEPPPEAPPPPAPAPTPAPTPSPTPAPAPAPVEPPRPAPVAEPPPVKHEERLAAPDERARLIAASTNPPATPPAPAPTWPDDQATVPMGLEQRDALSQPASRTAASVALPTAFRADSATARAPASPEPATAPKATEPVAPRPSAPIATPAASPASAATDTDADARRSRWPRRREASSRGRELADTAVLSEFGAADADPPSAKAPPAADAARSERRRRDKPAPAPAAEAVAAPATDAVDEPSFVRDARRGAFWRSPAVRALLWLVFLLLAAALAAQWAISQRDWLAAREPRARPALDWLCRLADCRIGAYRNLDAIVIDGSTFNRTGPGAFRLAFSLRNTADLPVAAPALELTLTDAANQPVLRRVLNPAEVGAPVSLEARGEFSGSAALSVDAASNPAAIVGYRLMAFYP